MQSKDLRTIAHALILVAFMLGLIAAALWLRGSNVEPQASAEIRVTSTERGGGIPDAGRQRRDMLIELQKINTRLESMDAALHDGKYRVQTIETKGGD